MRKTLFGLAVVCLLLTLPLVSASEASTGVPTATQSTLGIPDLLLQKLRESNDGDPSPQCIILITLAILFLKVIRWGALIFEGIILLIILKILRNPNTNTTLA
jgi:hypothetical protein